MTRTSSPAYRAITPAELAALQAFAAAQGGKWKWALTNLYWYNARVWNGPAPEMGPLLHGLRNDLGHDWLQAYKLPTQAAAMAQPVQQQQAKASGPAAAVLTVRHAFTPRGSVTLPRRTPNHGGMAQGVRFSAPFTAEYIGSHTGNMAADWQGMIHVYQGNADGAEYPRFETVIYRNGRQLPDSNLPNLRAAAVRLYVETWPDSIGGRDFSQSRLNRAAGLSLDVTPAEWCAPAEWLAQTAVAAPAPMGPVTQVGTIEVTPSPEMRAAVLAALDSKFYFTEIEARALVPVAARLYPDARALLSTDGRWGVWSSAETRFLAFSPDAIAAAVAAVKETPALALKTAATGPALVRAANALLDPLAAAIAELERLHGGNDLPWDRVTRDLRNGRTALVAALTVTLVQS